MGKSKKIISVLGIITLCVNVCFAAPTKSDVIKEEMENFTIIIAKAPHADIVTAVKTLKAIYHKKENAPYAHVIADCFKIFVYSLYPRHISAAEKGCLDNFYLNTLIWCFGMTTKDVEPVKKALDNLPNVEEHKRFGVGL